MFDSLFQTSAEATQAAGVDFASLAACMLAAIVLGVALGAVYMVRDRHTKSFVVTLALLPAVVAVVIMMVNGNLEVSLARQEAARNEL